VLLVGLRKQETIDWVFPKGIIELGETNQETASREVFEETGVPVRIGPYVESTSYKYEYNNEIWRKSVTYFVCCIDHTLEFGEPDGEVDEIIWLPIYAARFRLTYQNDKELLKKANREYTKWQCREEA